MLLHHAKGKEFAQKVRFCNSLGVISMICPFCHEVDLFCSSEVVVNLNSLIHRFDLDYSYVAIQMLQKLFATLQRRRCCIVMCYKAGLIVRDTKNLSHSVTADSFLLHTFKEKSLRLLLAAVLRCEVNLSPLPQPHSVSLGI